eukprot:CAMPEP_0206462728 /NCGR_PEP_ID=MMETSP0324_2-20121206/26158_1 /ASSEMBLY_ACC=CAM_ASM_000836 /TAXON_ID=2866 /ORGANISM="Crypthecodinium cohnii, Strain Seligo" /LENGTH=157 /DNA_ID=CAMNT_0053934953 /DNA_START=59 /DNA_END=532 /DNA_ORIENTATION=+
MFSCCCDAGAKTNQEVDRVGAISVLQESQDAGKAAQFEAPPPPPPPLADVDVPPKTSDVVPAPPSSSAPTSPGTFTVTINRKDENAKLGVDVGRADRAIRIKKVCAGEVEDHNKANPDQALQPMDLIVAVNGVSGPANDLLHTISTSNPLVLTIRRF